MTPPTHCVYQGTQVDAKNGQYASNLGMQFGGLIGGVMTLPYDWCC